MQVELIDYTGKGSSDPLYAAKLLAYTKNTRLEQGGEGLVAFMKMPEEALMKEVEYISNTLRSSWEFVDFTFQITGVTRAFTHQFVRTRNASYAQQAQRVVDMSNVPTMIPETVVAAGLEEVWGGVIESIADGYKQLQAQGIPNQDCRGLLPTNVKTNIIAKMNLRTLADLVGKRKNLRAQGEYGEVASLMEEEVLKAMPWAQSFLQPDRLSTPTLDRILKDLLGDHSPVDLPQINDALKELDKLKGTWG